MALNSKRMLTFFNEFLITTTNFLNDFASECDDKFFELERKMNKIESNLLIIEHKLASIPTDEKVTQQVLQPSPEAKAIQPPPEIEIAKPAEPAPQETPIESKEEPKVDSQPVNDNLIKISESALYRKYFKMLKVGIPPPAVKQKMTSEELDPGLLDNPELMIDKTPEDFEEQ